jgi:dTDP-D-glucose 4,6-dehydratase
MGSGAAHLCGSLGIGGKPAQNDQSSSVPLSCVLLSSVHFAALIEVGESVKYPGRFYDNNVCGALTLIEAARSAGVHAMVFSST